MNAVASNHPFQLNPRPDAWFLPVMLAPSFYVMLSFGFFWGTGNAILCSPALLLIAGLLVLVYCGRGIYKQRNQPLHRQVFHFCALVLLVYLQMLLPRLWGWPVN